MSKELRDTGNYGQAGASVNQHHDHAKVELVGVESLISPAAQPVCVTKSVARISLLIPLWMV